MENKKNNLYELRFEVASERKMVPGYTVIPASDRKAEAQHVEEDDIIKKIQRYAQNGDLEKVKELLFELPIYKREDIKKMLVRSAADRGKILEI